VPDALLVWNEAQKQEAVLMHRFPPERVAVTGAQCFDRWFGKTPTRSREAFMRMVGLPDDKPYVLWACSALLPGARRSRRLCCGGPHTSGPRVIREYVMYRS
jgi:hypothetical protein